MNEHCNTSVDRENTSFPHYYDFNPRRFYNIAAQISLGGVLSTRILERRILLVR